MAGTVAGWGRCGMLADAHGRARSDPRPDLVEERKRSRLALQRVADELAHRGLDLALGRLSEAESGDRLDIESLIGLEELQAVE